MLFDEGPETKHSGRFVFVRSFVRFVFDDDGVDDGVDDGDDFDDCTIV